MIDAILTALETGFCVYDVLTFAGRMLDGKRMQKWGRKIFDFSANRNGI